MIIFNNDFGLIISDYLNMILGGGIDIFIVICNRGVSSWSLDYGKCI